MSVHIPQYIVILLNDLGNIIIKYLQNISLHTISRYLLILLNELESITNLQNISLYIPQYLLIVLNDLESSNLNIYAEHFILYV
jgi:hypothetical protein